MAHPPARPDNGKAELHQAQVLYRLLHVLAGLTVLFVAALAIAPAKAYFSGWRSVQDTYNTRAKAAGMAEIPVRIRQIWRPEVKLTDRCITCHVAMGGDKPLPDGGPLYGAHPDVHHDVATMGCTGCHRGQGRATTKADAHGVVKHWEDPMLPSDLLEASCATCHGPGARVPPLAALEKGEYLFELHGCKSCHEGGRIGPDLSGVALKGYSRDWQVQHLKDPGGTVKGSKMMRFGHLTDGEVDVLVTYMDALIGAPKLARGKALAMEKGCRGCHQIGGVGGDDGGDLADVGAKSQRALDFAHVDGERTVQNWQRQHLRQPQIVSPGSVMPAFVLSQQDEDALVTFIMSLRKPDVPMEQLPKLTILAQLHERRDYPQTGEAIYSVFCSACHGPAGAGQVMPSLGTTVPAITNPDLLSVMSEGYLRRTLATGRPGRHMPAWGTKDAGLKSAEIDLLVDFILSHRAEPPSLEEVLAAPADVSIGRARYGFDCSGCHGVAGEGTVIAPSLVNPEFLFVADDRFLYETIARGRDDTAMPSHAHYDASTIASVIAWIRSHTPTTSADSTDNEPAVWDAAMRAKVLPRLFVNEVTDYRAGGGVPHGALLFKQTCQGCHGPGGHGGIGPAIGNPGFLKTASDGFIAASILLGRGQRGMRSFDEQGLARMTEREVSDIIAYLRQSASQVAFTRLQTRVHANVKAGEELFGQLCVGCHGQSGVGRTAPALNNQGFLDSVTDGFLQATIARGRRGTAMRAWAIGGFGFAEISPEEINNLVAYIRSWHVASKASKKESRPR